MKEQFEEFIYQRLKTAKEDEVKEILSIFNEEVYKKGTLFKKEDTVIQNLGNFGTGGNWFRHPYIG